jgi:triacylglycerol lipase
MGLIDSILSTGWWVLSLFALLLALVVLAGLVRTRPWRGSRTRYPVVLAHGILGFGEIEIGDRKESYFRGIPEHLEQLGLEVHRVQVPLLSSVARRAGALSEAVKSLGVRKVNIIAHSMGGLDARYAISRLGLKDRVASLTTVGTPHRGTPVADLGTKLGETLGLRRLMQLTGIDGQGVFDMTTDHMQTFNSRVPDATGVHYACVVSSVDRAEDGLHAVLAPSYAYLKQLSGPNDGLIPAESQRWGETLAEINADHWAQIGWSKEFDAPDFFEELARKLRQRGF